MTTEPGVEHSEIRTPGIEVVAMFIESEQKSKITVLDLTLT